MFRLLIILFFASFLTTASATPLTVKEISLMLRAGYSNSSVMQELAKRGFADPLTIDKEDTLAKAGANQELIEALKGGTYDLSAGQMEKARAQLARQNDLRAAQEEKSSRANAAYEAQVTRDRSKPGPAPSPGGSVISEAVKGDLVRYQDGAVVRADDSALANKRLIGLYFSAHWCSPCRRFTPDLVSYYNRVAPEHPEFEIIFVSADRSAFAMEQYMQETNMPWLAIDYAKVQSKESIRHYMGNGIPCLVLVDGNGKILSDSFAGSQYLGPQKVLSDLDSIFAGGGTAIAQKR